MTFISEDTREPITVTVSRQVKPGREQEFEALLAAMTQEARNFSGYLGANIIRPSSKAQPDYVLIFRFDSYTHLKRWEESPVRLEWLQRADAIADSPLQLQKTPGLEFWFTPQSRSAPPTPPRYKMAIILTLVIFTLSLVFTPMLKVLLGNLPVLLSQFIAVVIQVVLMTYLILPFLTKLLAHWLFATRRSKQRTQV